MNADRWDDLGARLFAAARLDRPSHATLERAASAVQRRRRVARRWAVAVALGGAVAALAAAGILLLRAQSGNDPDITMEQRARSGGVTARRVEPTVTPPIDSAAPPVRPTPPANSLGRPVPASLADELGSLNRARAALGAGNAADALSELDRYDRVLRGTRLRSEATLLRIEALARAGRAKESADVARRFIEHSPDDPLVDRARKFTAPAASGTAGP